MSRLNDLLRRLSTSDASLAADLKREVDALADRRAFGLNFERHVPEAVELPGRKIRKGDKVRVLPVRGESSVAANDRLWRVLLIDRTSEAATAELEAIDGDESRSVSLRDLVVVAEFRDPIYPGLVSTGRVERGGDKPFHSVINSENFHALQTLLFTHRGKVDCIYIDPPYNTGAKDWKYNNNYVEGDDVYRHSKWLAFIERRLLLARELLKRNESVLIVTIDEKEYLRLGLLLEQVFPEARITMVTSSINSAGSARQGTFRRSAEYIFFVQFGDSRPEALSLGGEWNPVETKNKSDIRWNLAIRSASLRADSPNQFYPVFVENTVNGPVFHSVGESYFGSNLSEVQAPDGCVAIWPIRQNGQEGRWQNSAAALRTLISNGYARLGPFRGADTTIYVLTRGEITKVETGVFKVLGSRADGSVITDSTLYSPTFVPTDVWRLTSHDAGNHGSRLLSLLMPDRRFPFPKSLYAVEDALRFFINDKPEAVVLDFFAGSGTTAHSVMRLNKQDGGSRQCISVTNNEVSAEEQRALRKDGLRPGDAEWEMLGICNYITMPRIKAAITGETPQGDPIKGDYKFTDEFPMSEGFQENVEFFTLTYESPLRVSSNREFARIAPLLWMRAGSYGRRIDDVSGGWDVGETYGVLADMNQTEVFLKEVASKEGVRIVYIVTDEDRLFESVTRELPEHVEPLRLYEAYLRNFEIETGRNSK